MLSASFVAYLLDSYPQKAETQIVWQKILNNILLFKKSLDRDESD